MYKKIFDGKKAALFNLEGTLCKEINPLIIEAFQQTMQTVFLGYIDPTEYCIPGYSLNTIWKSILQGNQIEKNAYRVEDLLIKTEQAFLEILRNDKLETTEGFWDLIYELIDEKEYKVGLVSNLSQKIQEELSKKLGLEGIFDVVSFNENGKEILDKTYGKAIRNLKIKKKKIIAFEGSIPGVKAANKKGVDVIVIWDLITRKSFYGNKVKNIDIDFAHYVGRTETTYEEYLAESVKGAIEDKKQKQGL